MIEIVAQLKNLRMSPKKVRLVTDSIKGLDVNAALVRLKFTQKISAPIITKLLKSAIANAKHNKDMSADTLLIKNIVVNQALALKRWKPAAHGAAHPFKKPASHIRLVLTLKSGTDLSTDDTTKKTVKEIPTVKVTGVAKTGRSSRGRRSSQDDMKKHGDTAKHPAARKSITRTTSK